MDDLSSSLMKTLAFHMTWRHAPTRVEWMQTMETDQVWSLEEIQKMSDAVLATGRVTEYGGRYFFPGDRDVLEIQRSNELSAARKRRVAVRVARWLARLSTVRFIALCNTNALGHARDESDLDFFIIVRRGTLMTTRGLAALPFKLLRRRPSEAKQDPICLSYFVTDDALDLSSHMLTPDDPYFRNWFLSLLPLYDDGIGREFWKSNQRITSRHAMARPWIPPPDLAITQRRIRIPVPSFLEKTATRLQTAQFPRAIHDLQNRDTRVMVTPHVLKFHVDDTRESYRSEYEARCHALGIPYVSS